ncbi:hypothetical protein SRABI76_03522 [Microbacterium oxydans]|uniref:Uncharacterized protein n=1 Tax=Microbacterium oxydans TaxID=82380 RepID=A0A0F0LCT3_9MICO|nr:DUF6069 family protein [Microbacterium oxydans]KJL30489.1 hypothetical protein RS83_00875 [Microbacterium oxydans]CAH0262449.1 hypothetical protein SRABI76_03522 [Microbacterium oxydans]
MAAIAPTEHPTTRSRVRVGITLLAAAVVAILLNAAVAAVAVAAGAPSGYGPLTPPAYGLFTVLGVGIGWLGWRLVLSRSEHPSRTLSVLVPVVLVASFIPDILLLVLRFIPGTTTSAAIALMAMHVVVVLVAVPAYLLATRQRMQVNSARAA